MPLEHWLQPSCWSLSWHNHIPKHRCWESQLSIIILIYLRANLYFRRVGVFFFFFFSKGWFVNQAWLTGYSETTALFDLAASSWSIRIWPRLWVHTQSPPHRSKHCNLSPASGLKVAEGKRCHLRSSLWNWVSVYSHYLDGEPSVNARQIDAMWLSVGQVPLVYIDGKWLLQPSQLIADLQRTCKCMKMLEELVLWFGLTFFQIKKSTFIIYHEKTPPQKFYLDNPFIVPYPRSTAAPGLWMAPFATLAGKYYRRKSLTVHISALLACFSTMHRKTRAIHAEPLIVFCHPHSSWLILFANFMAWQYGT